MKTATKIGIVSTVIESIGNRINEIAAQEEALKKKIAPTEKKLDALAEETKELRAQMAEALVASGRNTVYIDGWQFSLKHDTGFEISNEQLANEWAIKNNCLRFDKVKANTLLRREVMTPDGFVRVEKKSIARTADKKAQN